MTTSKDSTAQLWPLIPFSGSPLDRAGNQRKNRDWLKARMNDATTRFLPLSDLKAQVEPHDGRFTLGWLTGTEADELLDATKGQLRLFLGLMDGIAHFAIDAGARPAPAGRRYMDVRTVSTQLPEGEASILAQARSMIDWHARHGFCAKCGHATEPGEGGYLRQCQSAGCNTQHFPRTDPVVIMLVEHEGRCLLGRGKNFPKGSYSALAGFMEPGESLEEAVRREIFEEAGVKVGAVRYIGSQPWPFPSSLMIGCIGEAVSGEITIDPEEIEIARWFDRDQVTRMMADCDNPDAEFRTPGRIAMAHHLILRWLKGG
jgi:NAD+ diphosphatase